MGKHLSFLRTLLLTGLLFLLSCNQGEPSEKNEPEADAPKKASEFSASELYSELEARAELQKMKQLRDTPPGAVNPQMSQYSNKELYEELLVIYGEDNRRNLYEKAITDTGILNNAGRVACLVSAARLQLLPNGNYKLIPNGQYTKYDGRDFCSDEKFYGEPVAAFCTGFAISKNTFATAGHCLTSENFANNIIVYGFSMKDSITPNLVIKKENVFKPVEIIKRTLDNQSKNDFCLLKVDRQIPAGLICGIRKSGKVPDNESLYVIGHPSGLPVKITEGGRVYKNDVANYFVTNLDTYGGNSGSPVFNAKTHIVEGILVRGATDYTWWDMGGCVRSNICPESIGTCNGEDVSRASQFVQWIK